MLPSARTTESDGALGIRPSLSGLPLAIVGQTTAGTANAPASFTDPDQVQAALGAGRAVEQACYALERFGRSVVVVKTATTGVPANYGSVDDSGVSGSSTITIDSDGSNKPNDDYQIDVLVSTDDGTTGTIGNASPAISLAVSLDAGRSRAAAKPLGTANTYTIPGTNVKIDFGAGTLEDGDRFSVTVEAEHPDDTELAAALDALKVTALSYDLVHLTSPIDASGFDVADVFLTAMHNAGKHKHVMAHFRLQGLLTPETDADYITAFNAEFSAKANSSLYVAAGAVDVASSVTRGRMARRAPSFPASAMMASVSEEVDIAAPGPSGYALPGCQLRDSKGNPRAGYYDESVSPGLDDVRALTLRIWDGETGVYVNNPRLLSAVGSDFDFSPKRRVMNLARGIAVAWLRRNVQSRPLRVNKATGFVRESELLALEAALNAELTRQIMAKPKASSVRVVLSRNDAVLQAPYPLTGKLRMVPLAYPKDVSVDAGWELSEPITISGVIPA